MLKPIIDKLKYLVGPAGELTLPNQPRFLVRSSGASNVTGISTLHTCTFGVEIYDPGGNFSSQTFTAPVPGHYLLVASLRVQELASATFASLRILTDALGGNRVTSYSSPIDGTQCFKMTELVYMEADEIAQVALLVQGMAGETVDIASGFESRFEGALLG